MVVLIPKHVMYRCFLTLHLRPQNSRLRKPLRVNISKPLFWHLASFELLLFSSICKIGSPVQGEFWSAEPWYTVEDKFRVPPPRLPSFMTIGIVWRQEQHDEVRCLWKTYCYCSIVCVRNNAKNDSKNLETTRSVRFTETNQELGSLGSSWVRLGFEEPNPGLEN